MPEQPATLPASQPVEHHSSPSGAWRDRLPAIRMAISLVVAALLVVPESEIRAKLFKANLILSNVKRLVH